MIRKPLQTTYGCRILLALMLAVILVPSAAAQKGNPKAMTKVYLTTLRPASSVSSLASGTAILRLSQDEKAATLRVNLSNLSAPKTSMHVRGGHSNHVLFDFDAATPQADGSYLWTFTRVGAMTPTHILQALKTGRLLLQVQSARYPSGELRGQFLPVTAAASFTPPAPSPVLDLKKISANDAARFLTQATFGPRSADISALPGKGYEAWLQEQFAAPTESHVAYIDWLRKAEPMRPLYDEAFLESFWKQAVHGNDQLRQRVSFALSQILVVSFATGLQGEYYAVASYADMLDKNAFGNFRQLLEDVSLHPAMGRYLDHLKNDKEDPVSGRQPNENFARELLQLFSIGLYQLHPDGTLKLDANGFPIETYDQNVIKGFARVFTGWSYGTFAKTEDNWLWPPIQNIHDPFWRVPMELWPQHHSTSAKQLLNDVMLPPNQTAQRDLKDALDNIFQHPNVGPFIARQLIQRLVTSNPSPGYVFRVAQKFNNNGSGVRGDMKAVIKAILLDYEARHQDVAMQPGFGKLREPVVRMAHLLRAFNFSCTCGKIPLYWTESPVYALAQNAYRAPTAFNFFEPNYSPPGTMAAEGMLAPEFQITNEISVTGISNFMRNVIFTGFQWDPKLPPLLGNYSAVAPMAAQPAQLVEHLNLLLLSGQMPAGMKNTIIAELTKMPPDPIPRVKEAIHSIMT
ncbi:MAG TPA: DUF1800 family protein, partial [Blastocatellia bacterium]|nr:DUF1800 family protein [Blastocatellia bacterium]